MTVLHVSTDHDKYGKVPLCGQAMWDELVEESDIHTDDLPDTCWECKSILGLSDEPCNTCGGTRRWESTTEDSPTELVYLGRCPDCTDDD